MTVNQRNIRVLNKVLEAGFTDEKIIAAMTIDDMLTIPGISVGDIAIINELQKGARSNQMIAFLTGGVR